MFQAGVGGCEVAFDGVGFEQRDAAKSSSQKAVAGARNGVDVVVDETLESVKTVDSRGRNEGEAGRGGDGGAARGEGDVGDVVGDEAVATRVGLAWIALAIEENQAIPPDAELAAIPPVSGGSLFSTQPGSR